MANHITLTEKERRFDEALEKLQRTVEAGDGVAGETLNEFLEAAENHRRVMRYKALLAPANNDSDSNAA
jgi:hypothetical protein